MRAYLIDEISPHDMTKIGGLLRKKAIPSRVEGIFWMEMPKDLLTPTQLEHRECRPHVFAVELGPGRIKLEFLIRSLTRMSCTCSAYCNEKQRNYIVDLIHQMIHELGIRT